MCRVQQSTPLHLFILIHSFLSDPRNQLSENTNSSIFYQCICILSDLSGKRPIPFRSFLRIIHYFLKMQNLNGISNIFFHSESLFVVSISNYSNVLLAIQILSRILEFCFLLVYYFILMFMACRSYACLRP